MQCLRQSKRLWTWQGAGVVAGGQPRLFCLLVGHNHILCVHDRRPRVLLEETATSKVESRHKRVCHQANTQLRGQLLPLGKRITDLILLAHAVFDGALGIPGVAESSVL